MNDKTIESLSAALNTLSEDDFTDILAKVDPVSWTENRRMLKGQSFSFKDRDYLMDIYRDNYPQLIIMKGRQVEMSEFSMNWLLHRLDRHEYTNGLHAFPRSQQAQRFSKLRVQSAIDDSQYLNHWYSTHGSEQMMRKFTREKDSKGLTPVNFYIMGATWQSHADTVGDATRGMSVDFIVYDERQDHPNDVETVLGEGASHSDYKQTLTLGTPKLPGIQFDQQWEASDKRYWFVICKECGYDAPITMDNILMSDNNEYYYGCPHCRKEIDRRNGRWKITKPHPFNKPEYHGYHISQLMVPWISAEEIMRKKNSTTYPRRRFHNEVLGEAYGGDDLPITISMMHACAENDYSLGLIAPNDSLFVGVDWGAKSWAYVQDKSHRLVDCFVTDNSDPRKQPEEIANFLLKYKKQVKKVVCDAGPDIMRAYVLRDLCKEKGITNEVWACYYSSPPAKSEVSWNEKEKNVTVGRSEAIERIIDEIHNGDLIIPGRDINIERVDTLMEHFTNIAAEKDTNKSDNTFIVYVATGPDHFLHAKIYADVASGGVVSVPIGQAAPPIVNARRKSTSGLAKVNRPSTSAFPSFNRTRRR